MKFRSAYSPSEHICSPCGKRIQPKYKRVIHSNGSKELVDDGVEDVYDFIQLSAKGMLLSDLIRRSQAGDTTALGSSDASYGDITNAPGSLLEAELALLKAREIYDGLPVDIKKKYGSDYMAFLEAVDNGSFVKDSYAATSSKLAASELADVPAFSSDEISKIKEMINK